MRGSDGTTDVKTPEDRGEEKVKIWVQILMFVGVTALYLLIGYVLWRFLNGYIQPKNSGQKKDLVQALGLIMAGVAGAIGQFL